MDRVELAKNLFADGLNCSQAVVLAFKDILDVSEDVLKKSSIPFGGGLGRQRLTCGAVSGMCMVLGLKLSDGKDKLKIYSIIQQACDEFKKITGSIICGELLDGVDGADKSPVPSERTAEYYKKRPCSEMCQIAVKITEKFLAENS